MELSKSAQNKARKALERQEKLPQSKRGGLSTAEAGLQGITSGRARAASIARGELQPAEDLLAFFDRFNGKYLASLGKSWDDSKAQQSWDLWGGSPGYKDVKRALANKSRKNPEMRKMSHKGIHMQATRANRKPVYQIRIDGKVDGKTITGDTHPVDVSKKLTRPLADKITQVTDADGKSIGFRSRRKVVNAILAKLEGLQALELMTALPNIPLF